MLVRDLQQVLGNFTDKFNKGMGKVDGKGNAIMYAKVYVDLGNGRLASWLSAAFGLTTGYCQPLASQSRLSSVHGSFVLTGSVKADSFGLETVVGGAASEALATASRDRPRVCPSQS